MASGDETNDCANRDRSYDDAVARGLVMAMCDGGRTGSDCSTKSGPDESRDHTLRSACVIGVHAGLSESCRRQREDSECICIDSHRSSIEKVCSTFADQLSSLGNQLSRLEKYNKGVVLCSRGGCVVAAMIAIDAMLAHTTGDHSH